MKVHHLNCGTMRLPSSPMVCHVLAVETPRGIVLIDTGIGLLDVQSGGRRFGGGRFVVRPSFRQEETAFEQLKRLGFGPGDVSDILLTHADADHVGGLADFPQATVHMSVAEVEAVFRRPPPGRARYDKAMFVQSPQIVEHEEGAERWLGGIAATPISDLLPGLLMISLPGHSPGHVGYAFEVDGNWLVHAGDAFYDIGSIDDSGSVPFAKRLLERIAAYDYETYLKTQGVLRNLVATREHQLRILCSHDPSLMSN